jgi:uncharacterized Zn finger protein
MSKKATLKAFQQLSWDDLNAWVGSSIVSRGKSYQRQGLVSELAVTADGALLAWVDGAEVYATTVFLGEDGSLDSECTCPYGLHCKHAVAAVLEYLECVKKKRPVPEADADDERLLMLDDEYVDEEDEPLELELRSESEKLPAPVERFLREKTKAQLVELIGAVALKHPAVREELADRVRLQSGDMTKVLARLRGDIRKISERPGWGNPWSDEGYTPDYSGIRNKLLTLLEGGCADDVLSVGEELLESGVQHVEESHDEGETGEEVSLSLDIVCKALPASSLSPGDKLLWAVDAILRDPWDLCYTFEKYLNENHPQDAWSTVADELLRRLASDTKTSKGNGVDRSYERDRLSDQAIHALERAGRDEEVIALCEAEAPRTGSYERLVRLLIESGRYGEAEQWIEEGIEATQEKWPGIASGLRQHLLRIRTLQEDWPAIAAMRAAEFTASPCVKTYDECRKAMDKIGGWDAARPCLLHYLETGDAPWKQKAWPLKDQSFEAPRRRTRDAFPDHSALIDIYIHEDAPEMVLHWYDKTPKRRFHHSGDLDNRVAGAVQGHAPDRAVKLWRSIAEGLIAQVKPKAYHQAAVYLRKAAKVMSREQRGKEWDRYIQKLRSAHARKPRLMEVLDGLDGKPIVGGGG